MYKKVLLIKDNVAPFERTDFSNAHPGIQAKKNASITWTGIVEKMPAQKRLLSSAEYLHGFFLLSHGDILYICNLESPLFSRVFKDILKEPLIKSG